MDLITTLAYHTANSYGTLAEAEAYFTSYSRLGSSETWSSLSTDQKKFALMIAAQVLNTFGFRGLKCIKNQKLAFPRYTVDQLNGDYAPLDSFYGITYTEILADTDFNVLNNKIYATNSSLDDFYDYIDDGDLLINQMIKVDRGGTEYFTITDMDIDGAWIEVQEDIEEETDTLADLYASDIFGFPVEVKYAQFETAYQIVDTKIFQGTVGEETERPVASFNVTGALSVRYQKELFKSNRFENSVPLDLIYYLLGPWLAGIKGYMI